MKQLKEKFKDDGKDFEKIMKKYIDNKISHFIEETQQKVEGNEILVSSGTIDTGNSLALIRKNIFDLQS